MRRSDRMLALNAHGTSRRMLARATRRDAWRWADHRALQLTQLIHCEHPREGGVVVGMARCNRKTVHTRQGIVMREWGWLSCWRQLARALTQRRQCTAKVSRALRGSEWVPVCVPYRHLRGFPCGYRYVGHGSRRHMRWRHFGHHCSVPTTPLLLVMPVTVRSSICPRPICSRLSRHRLLLLDQKAQ